MKIVVYVWYILELEDYIGMCWVIGLGAIQKDDNHKKKR